MSKWELCQTSSVSVTLFVENLLPPFFLFHGPKPAQKKPFGLCHILTTSAVFETRKTGRYKKPPNRPTGQAVLARLVMLMLLLSFLMSGATAQATNASCLLQINRSTAGRGLEFFYVQFVILFFCVRYGDSRDSRVNVSVTFAYRNCYHCLWSFSRLSRFIMYAIALSKL